MALEGPGVEVEVVVEVVAMVERMKGISLEYFYNAVCCVTGGYSIV